jgi:XTP/dITP diphosphohydrolase
MIWKLNTSNLGKFEEFKSLFALYGSQIEATHIDLPEIDATPLQVIAHKASQLDENIIVDDTSLEVEGVAIGVNIRWLLQHLAQYAGHRAEWTALLAVRQANEIYIYQGAQKGSIVLPQGQAGFGFDAYFLPEGATQTLAESKPHAYNARAKAVESLLKGNFHAKHPILTQWNGPWQEHHHSP